MLNHLCAVGEVEKMYIPPVMDSKLGIFQNQMVWEEKARIGKWEELFGLEVGEPMVKQQFVFGSNYLDI